jgi:hypothetical protein
VSILQGVPLGISLDFHGFAFILQGGPPLRVASDSHRICIHFARGTPWDVIRFLSIRFYFSRGAPWDFILFVMDLRSFCKGTLLGISLDFHRVASILQGVPLGIALDFMDLRSFC